MSMVTRSDFGGALAPPAIANAIANTLVGGSPFANALTPMPTDRGAVAFGVAGPQGAGWTGEGQPIPLIDPHSDVDIVAVAKLAGIIQLSNEAITDDAVSVEKLLTDAATDHMSFQLDDGLLHGGGAPAPVGILAAATAAAAGANSDLRAGVVGAWGELSDAGADPASIRAFVKPSVEAAELARVDSQGRPIHADSDTLVLGPTPVTPVAALAAAEILVADVSRLFLIRRSDFQVAISPDWGFATDSVGVRISGRFAVGCPTPAKALRRVTVAAS